MRILPALGPFALHCVAASATATNVCIEFIDEHLTDSAWEQQCLDWLYQEYPPFSPPTTQAMTNTVSAATASSSLTPQAPVHVSASNLALAGGNQREAFIGLDPTDTDRLFYFAMTEPFSNGLFAAHSTDGGTSWVSTTIAVGPGGSTPAGRVDPWAVFSDAGQLFISYIADPAVDESATLGITAGTGPTVVAQSSDGGASFQFVQVLDASPFTDRPSLAVGSGGAYAAGS